MDDTAAMNAITAILDEDDEWNADTIDAIWQVVQQTGRTISDTDEPALTYTRT